MKYEDTILNKEYAKAGCKHEAALAYFLVQKKKKGLTICKYIYII